MPLLPENNPLLQEIHTTEETYNAQLVELIRRLNVLQPSEPGLAFIEPMVVQLTKMLGISKELLKASKGGTDVNAMLQQYLNIQAEISETFKKYPPLVSQFNTWWAKLNDEEKNRIDKATKDSAPPQFSSLSLSDFPIMPVRRLIRYELFSHELIKKNPDIPVYSAFQAAVKPEAKAMNDFQRNEDLRQAQALFESHSLESVGMTIRNISAQEIAAVIKKLSGGNTPIQFATKTEHKETVFWKKLRNKIQSKNMWEFDDSKGNVIRVNIHKDYMSIRVVPKEGFHGKRKDSLELIENVYQALLPKKENLEITIESNSCLSIVNMISANLKAEPKRLFQLSKETLNVLQNAPGLDIAGAVKSVSGEDTEHLLKLLQVLEEQGADVKAIFNNNLQPIRNYCGAQTLAPEFIVHAKDPETILKLFTSAAQSGLKPVLASPAKIRFNQTEGVSRAIQIQSANIKHAQQIFIHLTKMGFNPEIDKSKLSENYAQFQKRIPIILGSAFQGSTTERYVEILKNMFRQGLPIDLGNTTKVQIAQYLNNHPKAKDLILDAHYPEDLKEMYAAALSMGFKVALSPTNAKIMLEKISGNEILDESTIKIELPVKQTIADDIKWFKDILRVGLIPDLVGIEQKRLDSIAKYLSEHPEDRELELNGYNPKHLETMYHLAQSLGFNISVTKEVHDRIGTGEITIKIVPVQKKDGSVDFQKTIEAGEKAAKNGFQVEFPKKFTDALQVKKQNTESKRFIFSKDKKLKVLDDMLKKIKNIENDNPLALALYGKAGTQQQGAQPKGSPPHVTFSPIGASPSPSGSLKTLETLLINMITEDPNKRDQQWNKIVELLGPMPSEDKEICKKWLESIAQTGITVAGTTAPKTLLLSDLQQTDIKNVASYILEKMFPATSISEQSKGRDSRRMK